jgi:hypothetical protein
VTSEPVPSSASGASEEPTGKGELELLREEVKTLREQAASGSAYDPDLYLSPGGGGSLFYNRLSRGTRELTPMQQERSLELAYLLYESNPLGKSIVETPRDFILGDSMTVTSTDPTEARRKEQQAVIDAFWKDPINLMDIKVPMKVMELGLFGEQCWPVEVNPVNGHVRLGYIDPGDIKDIFVDPRNVEKQLAVVTYMRQEDRSPEERWFKIIAPEDDATSDWYGRLQGPSGAMSPTGDPGAAVDYVQWIDAKGRPQSHMVEGSCFYYSVNRVSNATRGRTDLLSLIDWVDAYDQLLFGEVDRGLLLKAFIWDVGLEGYNDKQIEDYKKKNPQPRPGSVRYHNEKVEWKAVTPDLKAADAASAADLLLSYISTGARLPKTWLNGMMDVNRATAHEIGTPALARLSQRQKLVKHMIFQVISFALDQAEMKGMLKKRPAVRGTQTPREWPIHVTLPDLKQLNQIVVAQAMNNIVAGVLAAIEGSLIDQELAQEVVVMFIEQLGIDVNLEALKERIAANPPVLPLDANGAPARPRLTGLNSRMPANGVDTTTIPTGGAPANARR